MNLALVNSQIWWFIARSSLISSTDAIGRRRGLLAAISSSAISAITALLRYS